ncbi:CHC2 zinc finger domain-containing protein [Margalitia sp. FSL K6-0131]|uniref:CHC2 zinc finger domain-containing protein n=1 Tax=Margalitia sp. FSL K6-0131 TaxID=2954604 RepID=UPI0030F54D67
MPFYPREVIEEINEQVLIIELVKKLGIAIRGSGKSISFLCPKCNGDWDNSRIHAQKNYFKCYRCEALGDKFQGKAINFVQGYLGYSLTESVEYLSNLFSLNVSSITGYSEEDEKRFLLYKDVIEFYQSQLHTSTYLQNRGVSMDVLQKVNAGFAPGGTLLRDHLITKGFTDEILKKYRLITSKGLDMMFNRAVLPIYKYGKPIDFYTRDTSNQAYRKHLYMHGEKIIYGHDYVKEHQEYLDIYEAPINQLVAWSNGFPIGIAIGGCTKFGLHHIRYIQRKSPKKVRLIFDPDRNGQGQLGAFHASKLLSDHNIEHEVVLLPLEEDPADLLLKENGRQRYEECLKMALPGNQYQAHFLLKDISIGDIKMHLQWRENRCSTSQNTIYSTLFSLS